MRKIQPYSRREMRTQMRAWFRKNRRPILLFTLAIVVPTAFLAWVAIRAAPSSPFVWWLLGVFHAGILAVWLHLLHNAFLAHNGEAIWHLRGAWGEDNTRSELERAKRKKIIWGWVDSLETPYGDIDHMVVTRQGGVVAIDSKWRNRINDRAEMARSAQKVRLRAEGLTRDLLKGDARGARRAKVNPLSVTAVVVVWGADQHSVPDRAVVKGIKFVSGRRLIDWLTRLEGQPVDKAAAEGLLRGLEERRIPFQRQAVAESQPRE